MGSNLDQAWIFFSNSIADKSQNYSGINNRFKIGDLGSGELKSWGYIMFESKFWILRWKRNKFLRFLCISHY